MRYADPPRGFEWVRDGRMAALVRSDFRTWMVPLFVAAEREWAGYETSSLAGGRGSARLVRMAEHAVVVRPYRRGGLPRWVLRDTYFGPRPRPFRELELTEALRRRGAPVIEVYGAAVRWLAPGCYRGWLATRYVSAARTLWGWIAAAPAPAERDIILRKVGDAIRRLHACGGRHPDLNMNNILVDGDAQVWLIDFDRARPIRSSGSTSADLARLRRSARKLDPQGKWVTAADFDRIEAASRMGASCA